MSVKDAQTLREVLRGTNYERKIETLVGLKRFIKRNDVSLDAVPLLLDGLRMGLISANSLVAMHSLTCLGHLIKRIVLQDAGRLRASAGFLLPLLIDKLGDMRDKAREVALNALIELWKVIPVDVEKGIKEFGFMSKIWRTREHSLYWLLKMHQMQIGFSFRSLMPSIIKMLEDANDSVRDAAKDVIIELFKNTSNHAKNDLKRELMEQNIRKKLVLYILDQLQLQADNDFMSSRGSEYMHDTDVTNASTRRMYNESIAGTSSFSSNYILNLNGAEMEQMDPAWVCSSKELETEIQEMLPAFEGKETDNNWVMREKHIVRLRALLRGNVYKEYSSVFISGFKLLVDGIIKAVRINSLRTTLSLSGLQFIKDVAIVVGPAIDQSVEVLLSNLIRVKVCIQTSPLSQMNTRTYTFDRVFGPEADQATVFDGVALPILGEVLNGYNCTIFAYGQTGTGKTYTMTGNISKDCSTFPESSGIIPRALCHLFNILEMEGTEYSVKCSFIELYNEELHDLLSIEDKKVKIFEDTVKKGVIITGMEDIPVTSSLEGIKLLQMGSHKRHVAATKCNDLSSRSHSIFTITVHIKDGTEVGEDLLKVGKLNLVDLAGSENIGRSGAENKRAQTINFNNFKKFSTSIYKNKTNSLEKIYNHSELYSPIKKEAHEGLILKKELKIEPKPEIIIAKNNTVNKHFFQDNKKEIHNLKQSNQINTLFNHIIGIIMKNGKRAKAQKQLEDALIYIKQKTNKDPHLFFSEAIEAVSPLMKLLSTKRGSKSIKIPVPLNEYQRRRKAIIWILEASTKRHNRIFSERLAQELIAITNKTSPVFQKKEQLHRSALINRANAQFRT
ncbi:hypothetical protein PCK2_000665 [Pneumocystis canis]|nr:hypothetical protein PCK2_000665 [Pneumocystis canis]